MSLLRFLLVWLTVTAVAVFFTGCELHETDEAVVYVATVKSPEGCPQATEVQIVDINALALEIGGVSTPIEPYLTWEDGEAAGWFTLPGTEDHPEECFYLLWIDRQ